MIEKDFGTKIEYDLKKGVQRYAIIFLIVLKSNIEKKYWPSQIYLSKTVNKIQKHRFLNLAAIYLYYIFVKIKNFQPHAKTNSV